MESVQNYIQQQQRALEAASQHQTGLERARRPTQTGQRQPQKQLQGSLWGGGVKGFLLSDFLPSRCIRLGWGGGQACGGGGCGSPVEEMALSGPHPSGPCWLTAQPPLKGACPAAPDPWAAALAHTLRSAQPGIPWVSQGHVQGLASHPNPQQRPPEPGWAAKGRRPAGRGQEVPEQWNSGCG